MQKPNPEHPEKIAPRVFTDYDGRPWAIEITLPEVRRIKQALEANLLELVDVQGDLFKRATTDVMFLVDLLFVVCQPQAVALGVTDEQFGAAMRGDAIEQAFDALFLAVADFFPKERRSLLESLHSRLNRYGTMAQTIAAEKINQPETEEQIRSTVLTALGLSANASASPGSLASIHGENLE
jgi:hypothetical protein